MGLVVGVDRNIKIVLHMSSIGYGHKRANLSIGRDGVVVNIPIGAVDPSGHPGSVGFAVFINRNSQWAPTRTPPVAKSIIS